MGRSGNSVSRLGAQLLDWVLPHQCFLCGVSTRHGVLCRSCETELPEPVVAACPVCGLPSVSDAVCGRCLASPPAFDATTAAALYAFPYDRMIRALKYQSRLSLAPYLADFLGQQLDACSHDLVLAMPLHPNRIRTRGFNQSVEIARVLAQRHGIRLELDRVVRVRDTATQADLPWRERQANMRDAFECRGRLDGKRVLVVDDVMTTGASLEALARVLKQAGAVHVHNLVVARTPPPD